MKSGFLKRPSMVTRVQKVVVTAVLAVSAVVGLSGSTAGAWSTDDGAVAFSGAGIFLIFAVLRRKRCLHCGRPLTLKDDILLDDEDNPECEENPEGKEHELRNDKRNEHENTVHSN